MKKANIEIEQSTVDIQHTSVIDVIMSLQLTTVDQVATQLNDQKGLAESLAKILSKVDIFVQLIDELSAVSLCALMSGSVAHRRRSDPPVSECGMASGLVFVQGTC